MVGLYPRTVSIQRAKTTAGSTDAIGLTGYSGMEESTTGSNPEGVSVLFTGIVCSIQAGAAGRKKDSALPQDIVWAPSWTIFIPAFALARYSVRDRDIILDDEGYRYEVGQNYWNLLGYKLVCVRLET
jgi:hypothetical protein